MGISTNSQSRLAAARAGHDGDDVAALRFTHHDDPKVRAAAVSSLARCGALDVDVVSRLVGDAAPAVRLRIAEEVAGLPNLGAEVFIELLADVDPVVVEAAAFALGERSEATEATVASLIDTATEHEDPLCRESAVASLGSLQDPAGLPTILAATHAPANIRRRATIALSAFDGPEVTSALERLTGDRDRQVRQMAADLLEISGEDVNVHP